jgi:phosphoheptose isomerase
METVKALPTLGERHEVKQALEKALEKEFDSVMLIGIKDGKMTTVWSGYDSIEHKIGCLELLKVNLITSAEVFP